MNKLIKLCDKYNYELRINKWSISIWKNDVLIGSDQHCAELLANMSKYRAIRQKALGFNLWESRLAVQRSRDEGEYLMNQKLERSIAALIAEEYPNEMPNATS